MRERRHASIEQFDATKLHADSGRRQRVLASQAATARDNNEAEGKLTLKVGIRFVSGEQKEGDGTKRPHIRRHRGRSSCQNFW